MESMHLGESVSFLPVSSDLLVIIVTLFTARRASMFSRFNKFTFHLKCRWWHVLIHLISDRSARKPAFVLWLHVAISWTRTHGDHTGPIAFNEKNQSVWSFDVCTFKNMFLFTNCTCTSRLQESMKHVSTGVSEIFILQVISHSIVAVEHVLSRFDHLCRKKTHHKSAQKLLPKEICSSKVLLNYVSLQRR